MSTTSRDAALQCSIYSGCIMFVVGMIGNTIDILTFSQLKCFRNNRCAFLLITEAIVNICYLFLSISLTILTIIYGDDATGRSQIWCKLRFILAQTAAIVSFYTICLAAMDQFLSTHHSVYLRQICSMKLVHRSVVILICFSIIHSCLFGLSFDVQPFIGCMISNRIALQYSIYFVYPLLFGYIPIMIASTYGVLAFHNVRRIIRRQIPIVRRRLDQQMTALVLSRVIVFVCINSPYVTYRIYYIVAPIGPTGPMDFRTARLVNSIFNSFISLNNTISFYVFCLVSARFRRQVKNFLTKKFRRQCKLCRSLRQNQVNIDNNQLRTSTLDSEDDS